MTLLCAGLAGLACVAGVFLIMPLAMTTLEQYEQVIRINQFGVFLGLKAVLDDAAVGPDRDEQPVRTFRTFTDDLQRLANWQRH